MPSDNPKCAAKPRKRNKHPGGDKRLYLRGRTIWCRVIGATGQKERLSTGCQDPIAAIAKANEYERAATDPSYRTAQETTLAVAVEDMRSAMYLANAAPATIEAMVQRMGPFLDARHWGKDFPLSKITAAKVKEFAMKRLQEPGARGGTISRATLGYNMLALRQCLMEAATLDKFAAPVDKIVKPRAWGARARRVKRYPTMEQAWALVHAMPPRPAAYAAYIFGTACRAEEARRARRSHHHVELNLVTIDGTKTRHCREHAREIPVSPVTRAFFDHALAQGEPGDAFITMTQGNLRTAILRACKTTGIGPFSPNDFRRAFCQWHKAAGYSMELCALFLRHQDTTMVREVYGQEDCAGPSILAKMQGEMAALARGIHAVPSVPGLYKAVGAVDVSSHDVSADSSSNCGNGDSQVA